MVVGAFRELKKKWGQLNKRRSGQYYGMVIDDPSDPLTNLRFADDVLLVAQSSSDIRKMMSDFRHAAEKYGLTLHPGKIKVMTTHRGKHPSCISVGTGCIEILDIDRAHLF